MSCGAMVLSFDLEMAWGLRSRAGEDLSPWGLGRVGQIVRQLLDICASHDISATWATVGHLMLRGEDCPGGRYVYDLPAPNYDWFEGPWYEGIPALGQDGAEYFYAPDTIRSIVECPVSQEIASHTFSHVYLNDSACTEEIVRAELRRCQEIASLWDVSLESLVFPRNLVGHLPAVREAGFTCYRAANSEWYWFGHPQTVFGKIWLRYPASILRWLDERMCLCPPLPPVRRKHDLWEIPHSMYFPGMRGVSKYVTPQQRVQRAVKGMRRAAEQGRIFSLFTHPHSFLPEPEVLLPAIDEICAEAVRLRRDGNFQVLSMNQIAGQLDAGENLHWTRSE